MGVRLIDEGYDFRVLVLDDTWVVRTPRHAPAREALRVEAALLPAVAPALPVQVPRFAYVSEEPPLAVYRLVQGSPLVDEEENVRPFLDALHGFDPTGLPLPAPNWVETYRLQADEFRHAVVPLLAVDERARAEALLAEVETLTGFEPVVTHSDLGPEHLLCREGRLVGVIDWGDTRVGDPALDYAWLLNVPFPHWDVDDELRRRARIYHRLGPWYEAHNGVFTAQPARVETGLLGIRRRL